MLDIKEIKEHLVALERGDEAQRRKGLQELRRCDDQAWNSAPNDLCKTVVQALQGQLRLDAKQQVLQKDAAAILGNIGPRSKAAIPQLIALLEDGVPEVVRESSIVALGKMGKDAKDAVGALVNLLGSPTHTKNVIRSLGDIGCTDKKARAALVALWLAPEQSPSVRANVAVALCKLQIPAHNLHATLTRTLAGNQDVGARKAAVEALVCCGKNDPDVVPALLTASAGDSNDDVRQAAQAGLDQMELTQEQAIQLTAKQLEESSIAEIALRKVGRAAVGELIKALGHAKATVRVKAARTLGWLGIEGEDAGAALTKALQDKDLEVRLSAAKSLWNVNKSIAVVPVLIDLLQREKNLKTDDAEKRRQNLQTVMEALGRVGPAAQEAEAVLNSLMKDTNRNIRECASNTWRKIASDVKEAPKPVGARR